MNHLIRAVRSKSLNRNQSRYQQEHETCVLCSTQLILKFETVINEKTSETVIREIAECPACTIRARATDHAIN